MKRLMYMSYWRSAFAWYIETHMWWVYIQLALFSKANSESQHVTYVLTLNDWM